MRRTICGSAVLPPAGIGLPGCPAAGRRRFGRGRARAEAGAAEEPLPADNQQRSWLCLLALLTAIAAGLLSADAARSAEVPASRPVQLLTLEDALRLAAERNRDIHKAMELRRSLEGRYEEERAAALPQLTLTANVLRQRDKSQALTVPGFGTVVPPAATVATAEAGLNQALFTWGQVGAAIRAAKVGLLTARDQLRVARQATARDVTAAFYDVLVAKELNAVARQALEQRLRHADEAKKRYSAGVATEFDVLSGDVAVANARPEVIRTENLIRIARDRLRFLLALEDEVDVEGTLEIREEPVPGYQDALDAAKQNRPELWNLRHELGVAREVVTIRGAGDKPRVDLKANFGYRTIDAGGQETSGTEWTAGIFASWPVFDGFRTQGRVAQAKSDLASLRIEERKLLDAIALNVREALNAVRQAAETVSALAGTAHQADRLLYMAEKGFEYGVKTKLEVDDAEFNVIQARTNLATARRDYLVARVTLEWVMGRLGE